MSSKSEAACSGQTGSIGIVRNAKPVGRALTLWGGGGSAEILSNVVDRPRELGGVLLHLSSSGLLLLHAVDEAHAGAHEW
jgi:hypothetical protein